MWVKMCFAAGRAAGAAVPVSSPSAASRASTSACKRCSPSHNTGCHSPASSPFLRPLLYQKARRAFHQCQRYRHKLAGLRLCLLGQLGGGARRPGKAAFRQRALPAQGRTVGHTDQRTQFHQRLIVVPGLFRRLMLHDPGGKGLFTAGSVITPGSLYRRENTRSTLPSTAGTGSPN